MPKPITVERGLEISILLTAIGVVLFVDGLSDAMGWWVSLGGWGFWSGGLGIVLVLVGSIWFGTIAKLRAKFERMIVEKSRAGFIRNLDELEYTAWRLPSKYDERVFEKKKDMGVK
jgi:hypothetical protein